MSSIWVILQACKTQTQKRDLPSFYRFHPPFLYGTAINSKLFFLSYRLVHLMKEVGVVAEAE
jgi:hypothetical protein